MSDCQHIEDQLELALEENDFMHQKVDELEAEVQTLEVKIERALAALQD